MNKRMLKKTITYFLSEISTKLFMLCMVFIYAFYISTDDLGKYEYIQTLLNAITPLFFISIWEGVLKFLISEKNKNKITKIIATTAYFTIFASFLIILIFMLYYILIRKSDIPVIYIILTYVINGVLWTWQHYAKALDMNRVYVKSTVVESITNLSAVLILLRFTNMRLEALFIANILGTIANLVTIEKSLKIIGKLKFEFFDIHVLKKLIIYTTPLTINTLLCWLMNGSAKVIIQNFIGTEGNGMYSFANKFTNIITFVGTILNMSITEEMFKISREEREKMFPQILENFTEKLLVILIILLPIIRGFYEIFAKTNYYQSKMYIPLLLINSLMIVIINSVSAMFKANFRNRYQLISTIAGTAISLVIMIMTIKTLGILGVIIGQLCGAGVNLCIVFICLNKKMKIKIKFSKMFLLMLIYALLAIILKY